jgi:outer membrane protein OmpA-like peptidoglycan-associated protein
MDAKTIFGVSLALALGACASTPKDNPALDTARVAVQSAEADSNVNKYDALDMADARKQLDTAETAQQNGKEKLATQAAYLAAQTARLAQLRSAAKADDARVASGQAERVQIELAARNRDLQNAQAATARANEQAARLQSELEQLKATPTPRGLLLTLGDVLFDTGKAQLKSGANLRLDQLAQFLGSHPDRRIEVDGFTDSVGSTQLNESLSEQRAEAVKAALVQRGIDPSRIATQGYGPEYPVASNGDAGGRQLNRRVEVVIGSADNRPIAPRS